MNKLPLFSAGTDRYFFAVAFRFLSAVLLAFAPAAVLCASMSNRIDSGTFSSNAAEFSLEQTAAFLVKRGEFSGNTPTLDISAAQVAPILTKAGLKAAERRAPVALTRVELAEIGARELTSSDLDWREAPTGKRVAHFVMTVEGTKSFRFVLDLKGVGFGTEMRYLGVDPNKQIFLPQVLEPSSASEIAQIWSPHIQGDQVTVEIATLPANEKLLSFAIKTIHVAPPAPVGVSKALASCAQDVACGASAITWQQSPGAVYILSSGGQCSATLLADSRGTRTPFLLTAAHCGVGDQETANSLSVDYYYRATTCGGATDQFQRITQPGGAAVIYTDPGNDEVLLELRQAPPASVPFLSYYGYDRGVPTGGTGLPVLGLSYPDGAREKLSGGAAFLRTGDLTTTPTRAGFVIHLNSWYHVPWSYGVTQPGSSGSGLFEETPNGLRLLGVDSAGSTLDVNLMCSPEYRYASYSRFDLSWPKMSHWLSPSIPANTAPIIAVEDYPYFIGVNARNNQLIVTHTGAQAAYVINGNTDHIYGKIETYAKPLFAAWNGATNTIYISDQQPYVLVVDGATLKVKARVAGYPNSNWIAVNELTNKTYVSSTTVAGILIVDGNNPNFTDAIPVPVPAIGMAIDAPNNRLYVAGAPALVGDGGLWVVDMAQKKVLSYVPTGKYPYSVVLDAPSNRAFINNAYSDTVSVVDLSSMSVIKTIATGNSPAGMSYNATSREVWVAAAIGGRITIVNAATLTSRNIETGDDGIYTVSLNPMTNKGYAPSGNAGFMSVVDGANGTLARVRLTDGGFDQYWSAFNPNTQKVYVTNRKGSTVSVFDTRPPTIPVVEYYNKTLDAHFITGRANEQTVLDGVADFRRTGMTFQASAVATASADLTKICRFYISSTTPFVSSHFYGRQGIDCESIRAQNLAGFSWEDYDFATQQPVAGVCPAGTVTIFRGFRAAAGGKTSNHRYSASQATYAAAVAAGYVGEGAAFCVTAATAANL